MGIYEIVSIGAFVAALVWALRSRDPINLGALFGGLLIFGFDWMWCSKSFFNATFTTELFNIPGLHIRGESYPFAVACNWAVGFGLIPVLAAQCLPTQAATRKETGSWKWAAFQLIYMSVLAYVAAFATYQLAAAFMG